MAFLKKTWLLHFHNINDSHNDFFAFFWLYGTVVQVLTPKE